MVHIHTHTYKYSTGTVYAKHAPVKGALILDTLVIKEQRGAWRTEPVNSYITKSCIPMTLSLPCFPTALYSCSHHFSAGATFSLRFVLQYIRHGSSFFTLFFPRFFLSFHPLRANIQPQPLSHAHTHPTIPLSLSGVSKQREIKI